MVDPASSRSLPSEGKGTQPAGCLYWPRPGTGCGQAHLAPAARQSSAERAPATQAPELPVTGAVLGLRGELNGASLPPQSHLQTEPQDETF